MLLKLGVKISFEVWMDMKIFFPDITIYLIAFPAFQMNIYSFVSPTKWEKKIPSSA